MYQASFDQVLWGVTNDFEKRPLIARLPGGLLRLVLRVGERWVAVAINRLALRLSKHVLQVTAMSQIVADRSTNATEAIDQDGVILDECESVRQFALDVQERAVSMMADCEAFSKGPKSAFEASRRLRAVASELCEAANQLRWDIMEHDASASAPMPGFKASSAEDVASLLDRISAGA